MINADPNSTCEQAKGYYYQYLSGDTKECIPTQMLGHIDRCRSCQAEIGRLKDILAEDEKHDKRTTGQTTDAITTNLKFHFAYLGALVDCKTLKLFLPGLAIPVLEVSVPTPITVHLDKCQKCTSDLEAIRQLKLSDRQLARLGQLFAEKSRTDFHECTKAQNAIASVGAMAFENTSPEILKHLCACPECRQLLYENRKGRIETLTQKLEQPLIPCDAASATDIFDYVIPYGIDPDDGLPETRPSASHLINCPKCLDKMQKLHETVYGILERRESGIVTCFKLEEPAGSTAVGGREDLYEDWPIEVQVFDNSVKTGAIQATDTSAVGGLAVSLKPNLKQKLSSLNIRPFIKPAAAAAAIILAALLLFNAPTTARAVNLGQIYKALGRITNVYSVMFDVEKKEPTQKILVSQVSNVMLSISEKECVFYDIKNKSQNIKDLNTGLITTVKMDNHVRTKFQEMMKARWDLLPSDDIFKRYPDAKWERVPNENVESPIPDTEVYDLMWTEKKFASRKWRGYVDRKTHLPQRIEWWLKLAEEEEYKLETYTQVSYPTTVDMKAIIKKAGF
jgi:hypothetical protein